MRSLIRHALTLSVLGLATALASKASMDQNAQCKRTAEAGRDGRGVVLLQSARARVRKAEMTTAEQDEPMVTVAPGAAAAAAVQRATMDAKAAVLPNATAPAPRMAPSAEAKAPAAVVQRPVRGFHAGPGAGAIASDERSRMMIKRLVSAVIYALLVIIVGFAYTQIVGLAEPPAEALFERSGDHQKGDFYFGILQFDECCGRDQRICVCAWCCLGIRWAETLSREKVKLGIGFWSLFLFCTVCEAFAFLGISTVVFVLAAVYFRQKLRAAFGLEHGTGATLASDCFAWCCCAPCAAAQEAREVEYLPVPPEQMG